MDYVQKEICQRCGLKEETYWFSYCTVSRERVCWDCFMAEENAIGAQSLVARLNASTDARSAAAN